MPESELTKHTVPATAAGFLFQFRRAVEILAEAPNGVVVGIETLDDISVEDSHGGLVLEQDKFTTKKDGNNLGDSSKNLLDTLSTWLEALLSGEISPDTTRFLLVTTAVCRSGLVRQIADATSSEDAQGCLETVKGMGETSEPKRRLLALLDRPQGEVLFLRLCQAVKLADKETASEASAAGLLQIPSAYESKREVIFEALCGWISNVAFQNWADRQPCRIEKQTFTNQLDAILNQLKREKRRERPARDVPVTPEEIEGQKDAVFVRQIKLVTDEDTYITDAIGDYLRCFSEKTRLSREGEITEKDWLVFSDDLKRRWSMKWSRIKRLSKESEEDTGFRIMTEVLDEEYHPKLAGEPTEQVYLTNGTYHRFADEKEIGWHPRYVELLEDGESHGHLV